MQRTRLALGALLSATVAMTGSLVFVVAIAVLAGCDDNGGGGDGGAGGAAATGGSAGAGGMAGGVAGCADNDECAVSEYCAGDSCRAEGECAALPATCDDVVEPVCGCDVQTYDNTCEAARAGVRVASEGECPCFSNSDCEPDEFCDAMYACSGGGECVARPRSCPPDVESVCGCDDVTYDNACLAAASGARVSAIGICDCVDDRNCNPDSYCNANTCDGPGVCETKPIAEDCRNEVDRVIVCNGNVFENPCRAAAAGQRIDRSLEF